MSDSLEGYWAFDEPAMGFEALGCVVLNNGAQHTDEER